MSTMNRVEAEEALALIRQVVNRVHDETVLHCRDVAYRWLPLQREALGGRPGGRS